MKTLLPLLCLLLLAAGAAQAQTKLFKAVAEDMDQDFKPIIQDGNLVGYLVFTQLEKASADSFNYRLTIMDENLNDIGTVNFREEKLNLKGVSFDQDVLCLAYIKSNFVGKVYRNAKEFRRDIDNARTALYMQFLSLNGKILATQSLKMEIQPESSYLPTSSRKVVGNGHLKHVLQLSNISGKGFVCFYGDDRKNKLAVFSIVGKLMWQKDIPEVAENFTLLTSGPEISLLAKTLDQMKEGGYQILSFNAIDSTVYPKFLLKDKKGNSLKVLAFDNDPVSGKPYVAGLVIDPIRGNYYGYGRAIRQGPYCGVFSISLNGHTRKDIQPSFTYWNDGSQSFMDKYARMSASGQYAHIERAFRDYQGNTIFAACGIDKKVRWGAITGAVLTVWTIYGAPAFLAGGTNKYATRDIFLLKQDAAGKLDLATTVPAPRSMYSFATWPVSSYDPNTYYPVKNGDTRTQYLVIDKAKDIDIYNVNQKKVARTIPHKEGNNLVTVYPAKEGYIMVSEYNQKEKTTRLSIEAL
jgi:hypothetical protein